MVEGWRFATHRQHRSSAHLLPRVVAARPSQSRAPGCSSSTRGARRANSAVGFAPVPLTVICCSRTPRGCVSVQVVCPSPQSIGSSRPYAGGGRAISAVIVLHRKGLWKGRTRTHEGCDYGGSPSRGTGAILHKPCRLVLAGCDRLSRPRAARRWDRDAGKTECGHEEGSGIGVTNVYRSARTRSSYDVCP